MPLGGSITLLFPVCLKPKATKWVLPRLRLNHRLGHELKRAGAGAKDELTGATAALAAGAGSEG